jgi:CheY-like chemotaxis protein
MKILVIDDEPIIRKLLSEVFFDDGHEVTCASNGAEALSKVRKKSFDIIFSDVHMPEMNGMETVKTIKRMNKEVDIIIMDSYPDAISQLARKEGAVACIHKPFELSEIRDVIRKVERGDKNSAGIEIN